MIDTKLLRQKILDLAIRGKLVPQDPNDEPASVLLQKIKEEKTAQVKAGKIKKDKHESVIFRGDDKHYYEQVDGKTTDITAEIPFDIPDTWEVCRLGTISSILYGVSESAQSQGKYKLLRITDIQNDKVTWDKVPFTDYAGDTEQYLLQEDDIVFARTGATVGKSYLLQDAPINTIYASYLIRVRFFVSTIALFIKFFFGSETYWRQISLKSVGTGQPNVNGTSLAALFIPIPSIAEQQRIISQIEALFFEVDKVDVDAAELDNALSLTKQKILDLAIRGKLVPQAPNDEPASALLKKIKIEKEALVKSGKIKRDKHESFIFRGDDNRYYEDDGKKQTDITSEILFDLPINWIWLRLKTAILPTGSRIPKTLEFEYIDIDSIDNHRQCIIEPKRLFTKDAPSRASRDVQAGDTLFSLVRPYLKNIAFVKKIHEDSIASTGFFVCRPSCGFIHKFLYWLMVCDYTVQGINKHMKGDNSPSVRREDIENFMIPLPPLAEQKRIVSQIERVFAQVETMQQ